MEMRRTGSLVLGVDVGSSGCKTVLVDQAGQVVASAARTYPTRRLPSGLVEQDPSCWLDAFVGSVREVTAADGLTVQAIGVTAPAHNAVLLDADDRPTAPVILWSDSRCAAVAHQQRRCWGKELLDRALVDLTHCWTLPQLAWTRANRPDVWARTRRLLFGKDYLVHELTGAYCTDPSDAAGTALFDQRARGWMADLLDDVGVPYNWLPEVRAATDVIGGLRASLAARCGLVAGTPVVMGATDTAAELVALGAVRPGDGLVKIATTGTVVTVGSAVEGRPGVIVYPHPEAGLWYSLAATNSAGASLAWFCSLFPDPLVPDDAQLEQARSVPTGADGLVFVPHIDGARSDGGLDFGAFVGLSAAHRREHLIRAVLEGVAFSLAECWDYLARSSQMPSSPFLTGGGLRNALWASIVLGVLNRPGRRVPGGEPATGVARLAACGIGITIGRPPSDQVIQPSHEIVDGLSAARARYQGVEKALRLVSHSP